jgi:Mg-chelatase subunit ChlD
MKLLKYLNIVFVIAVSVGILYSLSALLFPEKVQQLQSVIAQSGSQENGSERGVLGDLIAQVVPTAEPTTPPGNPPTATPIPPTLTPTPTAVPTPTPIPKYTLSGTVYTDYDQDATRDSGDPVFPGATITITGATTTSVTTTTNGTYSISLERGNYTVAITVPAGYKNTVASPQNISLTQNRAVNFGLVPTYTLNGNVFTDANLNTTRDTTETGYSGATITVSGSSSKTATTDAEGNYTIENLPYGNYSVTLSVPTGYKTTTTNPRTVSLTSNQTTNFGMAQVFTVNGNVFLDNNRNAVDDTGDGNYTGATVTLSGPSDVTVRSGADGSFSAQVFAGSYTATLTNPGSYEPSTPLTSNFVVGPNKTITFGLIPLFTISGSLFEDRNEDGRKGSGDSIESGITVTLSGAASATTTSDSNGYFTFSNLYAGTYTITYTLPAKKKSTTTSSQTVTFTSPSSSGTTGGSTTPAPPPTKTVEFGLVTLYNVVGKVFNDINKNGVLDPSEPFFQGAKVTLTKSTPVEKITDDTGSYSFLDQGSGDYFIAMDTPTGYRSTNANALNFLLTTDRVLNFGITPSTTTKVGGQCSANGVDIVIAFDDSGSMQQNAPSSGTTKKVAAQRAASSFIDIVSANVKNAQYSLVIFSEGANFPNSQYTRVLQPLTTSASSMKNAIAAIPNGGGTCVECGIFLANQELARSNRGAQKVVIVMTDGATNEIRGGGTTVDIAENAAMAAAINGVNTQNIIYQVVGIGEGGGDFDPIFMQQIADTNGGRFYNSPITSNLESIYQSIAEDIGTGVVRGTVFNDKNANKIYDAGDLPMPNWTVEGRTDVTTDPPLSTKTDNAGKYSITGLCTSTFNFKQVMQPGWYQTTDTQTYRIDVESGNTYDNNDFGNATGFTISGNIVNDFNRDNNFAPPDTLFTNEALVFFSGPVRKTVEATNGNYTSGALPPGTYNVSLVSPLTSGYRMTYPLNGPPPTFQVTIGNTCNVNGAAGATCQ